MHAAFANAIPSVILCPLNFVVAGRSKTSDFWSYIIVFVLFQSAQLYDASYNTSQIILPELSFSSLIWPVCPTKSLNVNHAAVRLPYAAAAPSV